MKTYKAHKSIKLLVALITNNNIPKLKCKPKLRRHVQVVRVVEKYKEQYLRKH